MDSGTNNYSTSTFVVGFFDGIEDVEEFLL
jgi:hypothetical protein